MADNVLRRIHALRQMSVAELRREWERLYGEPTRSRNRDYLWRRLAFRAQELANGGLSDRAKARINDLAPNQFTRTPREALDAAVAANVPETSKSKRDPRLPAPGSVLTRQYHGREIRVLTLDDGFEWNRQHFSSLSAVARTITGAKWNGRLFFNLTTRKRKS